MWSQSLFSSVTDDNMMFIFNVMIPISDKVP